MSEGQVAAGVLLDARGVEVTLGSRPVLEHVDLTVRAGEIVTVIGPNGAGKTTLVRVLLGLLRPDRGAVRRAPDLTVGYMPQSLQVDPTLPLTVRRLLTLTRPGDDAALVAGLAEVGFPDRLDAQVAALSGGELRRVLLARALLREPGLLVLDEPTSGVDYSGEAELYQLIATLRDRRGYGILMVSHDLHLVMAATDQVVCLNRHVCCAGHPQAVSEHPEYLRLFGHRAAASLAVYSHRHDHVHALDGGVVAGERPSVRDGAGGTGR